MARSAMIVVILSAGLTTGILVGGCPKSEPPPAGPEVGPEPSMPASEGAATIQSRGSDTLLQVAQALAEAYGERSPGVQVSVSGGGSGTGFQALIEGTTDIANASRKIKEKELEAAKAKGIEPVEHVVGYDGIAVIVNNGNRIDALSISQLSDLYIGQITDWKALGSSGEVVLLSRDTASGTFEYFKEHVVQKGDKSSERDYAPSAIMLPSNAAIRDEVAKNTNAVGYVGLAYVDDSVKPLAVISDGGEPVAPSVESVEDGTYCISRPLFMYTKSDPSDAVETYLEWVLGEEGQAIVADEGSVPVQ